MRVLYIHNSYAIQTGEEHASSAIVQFLRSEGHIVEWYRRCSGEIMGSLGGSIKAFFAGIYNPYTVTDVRRKLNTFQPDVVQVQNLYPLISPSVFVALKTHGAPVVMRCPNYRLFCPSALCFDPNGNVCEKCLGNGKEFWMFQKNCMGIRFKSLGYALRGAVARQTRLILDNTSIYGN